MLSIVLCEVVEILLVAVSPASGFTACLFFFFFFLIQPQPSQHGASSMERTQPSLIRFCRHISLFSPTASVPVVLLLPSGDWLGWLMCCSASPLLKSQQGVGTPPIKVPDWPPHHWEQVMQVGSFIKLKPIIWSQLSTEGKQFACNNTTHTYNKAEYSVKQFKSCRTKLYSYIQTALLSFREGIKMPLSLRPNATE